MPPDILPPAGGGRGEDGAVGGEPSLAQGRGAEEEAPDPSGLGRTAAPEFRVGHFRLRPLRLGWHPAAALLARWARGLTPQWTSISPIVPIDWRQRGTLRAHEENEDKEKPSNPLRLLGFSGWRRRESNPPPHQVPALLPFRRAPPPAGRRAPGSVEQEGVRVLDLVETGSPPLIAGLKRKRLMASRAASFSP